MSQCSSRVSHDHSIRTDTCCAMCVLSTPNCALCIVVTNNTAEKYITPFDGEESLEKETSRDIRRITFST
jgi:hypothetical protein